jgi:hypothetical protein
MIPVGPLSRLFRGLAFFDGATHLPEPIPSRLGSIRDWAERSGLIFDPDQVLTQERVADISRVCSSEDNLLVAIAISGEPGSLNYFEYPFLPVRSLIRRGEPVDLAFWKITATDVKFGFRIAGSAERFLSESTGVHVVPKFAAALKNLGTTYPVETFADGSKHIAVAEGVRATFSKDARMFEVKLTPVKAAEHPA